ncbi:hypothetical protein ZIOFF_069550 [Zingiber officinale]|uniref:Early nodulin-93-like n=1 Tax=Zingiber officinale TaxID=94328 RepID=A0A8J5C4B0_ZINOF|nr:hypothetical protein ZIOFF_069550 [Zingiber officinale]
MASVTRASMDQKLAMAKRCSRGIYSNRLLNSLLPVHHERSSQFSSHDFMAEGVIAGAKAAVVATFAAAVPTVRKLHVRMLPWAKRNLNPTAQALIVSTAAGFAYFVVADKTVLAQARKNSLKHAEMSKQHK